MIEALEQLCRTYWVPLYAYLRGRGYEEADAQDLTQEFFARLLETNCLGAADQTRGRFRQFLLGAFKHFLANEWDRTRAVKRGGRCTFLSWDDLPSEFSSEIECAAGGDADVAYDRQWALTVLEKVLNRLQEESARAGKATLFAALRDHLSGRQSVTTESGYRELGVRLGLSTGAVQVAVSRLRQRYGQLLRAEIAHTVETPAEVDEEIRYLFRVIRQG